MPYGGIKMAVQAAETYGYEVSDKLKEIFTKYHKTHNTAVFDAYTPEMMKVRHAKILTGLPDTYGRGRIVGDYRRVALYGIDFLLEKKHRAFEPTTYAETREQALETGAGLAAAGIRPGDKVAILSEGCNAWITSELGVFYAGAVSVPLSVKLEESNDLLFRMRHAEVRALFVSKYQLSKIRRIRA